MPESPLISVVIPMYETPFLLLRKCLNSLLRQTFERFEVLVVDDGSVGDYRLLQEEYEAGDGRVRFLKKENGGVASARNYGIEHCRGEFLCFVDSDDYVEEFYLEGLYGAMEGVDLAICGVSEMEYPLWEEGLFNARMFFSLPSHFQGLPYINFSVNKLYRTDIIRRYDIRFPLSVKMGEDAMFLAQYYRHCEFIRCVRFSPYHYVLNQESAMRVYKPEYWDWESQVIREDWQLFHRFPLSRREELSMIHWLYEKMMGAANYYYDYETDPAKLMEHFQAILDHELIRKIFETDISVDTLHFTPQETNIVRIVGREGAKGIRKFVHKRIGL